ncbi:MAG TPA: flavodoxin domain-containing protein [Longimicrobiales bacterium]|nr:flavodoxin domain-containing protein [Longimicrobiales bacterium]
MFVLGVYGSRHGQALAVLRRVFETLRARGHDTVIVRGDDVPSSAMEEAQAAVVAASVWMGRHPGYVRDFAALYASRLSGMPSAFISISGVQPESSPGWREQARAYVRSFLDEAGWVPDRVAAFAGALRYTRYGPFTRWLARRMSRRAGGPTDTSRDWELTDWEAVDRFAEELAAELRSREERRPAAV